MLAQIKSVVSESDYQHVKRILTSGCPSVLDFDEPVQNKLKMTRRGNQKSVLDNPNLVDKLMNKEDKHSHIVTLHDWACTLGPNFCHGSQGIVNMKTQIWDSSTIRYPSDLVLNDQTTIDEEAEVIFGTAKYDFYWSIYNLRVS